MRVSLEGKKGCNVAKRVRTFFAVGWKNDVVGAEGEHNNRTKNRTMSIESKSAAADSVYRAVASKGARGISMEELRNEVGEAVNVGLEVCLRNDRVRKVNGRLVRVRTKEEQDAFMNALNTLEQETKPQIDRQLAELTQMLGCQRADINALMNLSK